jgi:hypothetical protein
LTLLLQHDASKKSDIPAGHVTHFLEMLNRNSYKF